MLILDIIPQTVYNTNVLRGRRRPYAKSVAPWDKQVKKMQSGAFFYIAKALELISGAFFYKLTKYTVYGIIISATKQKVGG